MYGPLLHITCKVIPGKGAYSTSSILFSSSSLPPLAGSTPALSRSNHLSQLNKLGTSIMSEAAFLQLVVCPCKVTRGKGALSCGILASSILSSSMKPTAFSWQNPH